VDTIIFVAFLSFLNIDYYYHTSSNYDLTCMSFSHVSHVVYLPLSSDFQIYTAVHMCFQSELTTVTLPFKQTHVKTQSWCNRRSSQMFSI